MFRRTFIVAGLYSAAWAQAANFQSVFGPLTEITASAVDAVGNVYVAGSTTAPIPVTAGAFQTTFISAQCNFIPGQNGFPGTPIPCPHAFVAKIDSSGARLVYATYLGGERQDEAGAIAVDASGNAYVTGDTNSTTFPVTPGAWQTTLGSGGFITKLNPAGSGLVFSTYLPGGTGRAITVDGAGNAFVAGTAGGATFPTTPGAFQSNRIVANEDAFVLKLNATGSGLIYSTLLGGTFADLANALAIDAAGNAYVAGITASIPANAHLASGGFTPFPVTPGALNEPGSHADVFVTEVNPQGTALVYSAVFGSSGDDSIQSLAIDENGAAYFAGYTASIDFPVTAGALRTGGGLGFAGKLNGSGSALVYSTYLNARADRIVVDGAGHALITGSTYNSDIATTPNAILPCFPSPAYYSPEPYILQLNSTGTALLYATYATGVVIAADARGEVYLASGSAILDPLDILAPIAPGVRCAVNAANYRGRAIAPGEILSLFGRAIGPEQAAGAIVDNSGKVATTLENTRVLIGGVPAPLLYVSPNQINLVAPFEIAGQTQTAIQIETDGAPSLPPFQTQVTSAAPGIFTLDGSGYGAAAALNQDGTLNSAANPAAAGSIMSFFVTGIGAMAPTPVDGSIPALPLAKPLAQVSIRMSSLYGLDLQYVGDAPGFVEGAAQINATVPKPFQPGPQTVGLLVGGTGTPVELNVTIFVR